MKKFLVIIISVFFLSFDLVDYALYQKDAGPDKFKASYIYNFTKSFEWPESKTNEFNIAILGTNQNLLNFLTEMSSTKTVGTKKIVVKSINSISESAKPEILYILPDKSSILAEAVSKYKGKGTLIITEKQGLAKVGAAINFVVAEDKLKFELNKSSAGKAGLVVSSKIEAMALKVID